MPSNNHFISVSRAGVLTARRKGQAPVAVATSAVGLEVCPDTAAQARGLPATLRVFFEPGGRNREVRVTAVSTADGVVEIAAFQARFEVDDARLGRWIRNAVELALDRAAAG